ncbi:MAG: hypothetical protein M1832_004910 [Thelocarpon impressellum]|nr:MAG: hypothetical protein M1832_004910 [Thelocarpon impressellum]
MASYKRSRATYEADLQAKQSPFVAFGTPLPPLDPDVRDDGSYVPVWKQEVTDERGRKRLHGAFTGGFSAGYFNTVGSKEGWTPATFVSSRAKRKDEASKTAQQRPEDFMDEEDLADAAEAERLQTTAAFAALGSTEDDATRRGFAMDLLKAGGDTMGAKLLRKMGWKDGQGVGPRVRRKARLEADAGAAGIAEPDGQTHLFAPENTQMISFARKNDQRGLGYGGETRLQATNGTHSGLDGANGEEDQDQDAGFGTASGLQRTKKRGKEARRGAFGVGVLNDTGSDDEDPYEIGPRVSYSRVIGGDKKTKKKKAAENGLKTANPLLAAKPLFISKRAASKSEGFRKCHDGRLPLEGFVLSGLADALPSIINEDGRYPPPEIPKDWKSSKQPSTAGATATFQSTADAARASNLDPKSRASLLGEAQLPSKSVFDFLSPAARERLVSASGKSSLPAALGESAPKGFSLSEEDRQKELWKLVPKVNEDIAIKALGRGVGGWMPYAEDEAKRIRYRAFLEGQAGLHSGLPQRPQGVGKDDWIKELQEFAHAAEIFKPMTGMMASRFTSSSAVPKLASDAPEAPSATDSLLSTPSKKAEDPADAAAKLGMFGPMTRSMQQFYPSRLVCKRFNVKPPSHVQSDSAQPASAHTSERGRGGENRFQSGGYQTSSSGSGSKTLELVSKSTMDGLLQESASQRPEADKADIGETRMGLRQAITKEEVVVDTERNAALEAERPGDAVFRAIFGSDDEDDE